MSQIRTKQLGVDDAPILAALLAEQRSDYLAHFHPFGFDAATLAAQFMAAKRDRFLGIYENEALLGFFMLRGFDEGYQRPSFGVFVAEVTAGRGLARFALERALAWCVESGVEIVMLKVAVENPRARRIYVGAGFEFVGICSATGQEMFEKHLSDRILK